MARRTHGRRHGQTDMARGQKPTWPDGQVRNSAPPQLSMSAMLDRPRLGTARDPAPQLLMYGPKKLYKWGSRAPPVTPALSAHLGSPAPLDTCTASLTHINSCGAQRAPGVTDAPALPGTAQLRHLASPASAVLSCCLSTTAWGHVLWRRDVLRLSCCLSPRQPGVTSSPPCPPPPPADRGCQPLTYGPAKTQWRLQCACAAAGRRRPSRTGGRPSRTGGRGCCAAPSRRPRRSRHARRRNIDIARPGPVTRGDETSRRA